MGRIQLKWPRMLRRKVSRHSPIRYIRSIYGRLFGCGLIRGKPLPGSYSYFGRSDWFTARFDCVKYVLSFVKNEQVFVDVFRHSLIGSEIFFNTIIQTSDMTELVACDNNLTYIDWKNYDRRYPGSPKTLDKSDIDAIINSNMFFARKFSIMDDYDVIKFFVSRVIDE